MSSSDGNQPEPTVEEWRIARELCWGDDDPRGSTMTRGQHNGRASRGLPCPACDRIADALARYRTRLVERAAHACFQVAVIYSMDAEAADEPEDAAHLSELNDVALRCRNAVLALLEAGGGERVRRCQRDGCDNPAWLCSLHAHDEEGVGCRADYCSAAAVWCTRHAPPPTEPVDVPRLRAMQQWECVAKGEHGDTCLDRFGSDAPEQCAPCLARRVLRGPTRDDATHPDEPEDRGYVADTPPLHEALESVRLNHLHETRILYQQANSWKHDLRELWERVDALEKRNRELAQALEQSGDE